MTNKGRSDEELGARSQAQRAPASPFVIRHSSFVIGLDAGGTKTVGLLARADDGAVVGRGVGGAGNIRAAGGGGWGVGWAGRRGGRYAQDGRGAATALREALLVAWDLGTPEAIIGRIYQQPPPREAVAALAPTVLATVRAGDAVAAGIVAA